jgi:hypothetical protein
LILNTPDGMETDHINHDGLDNRRVNLRSCTQAENQHNQQPRKKAKSSVFKGVCYSKNGDKWQSYITVNRKIINIGYFLSEIKAALAYDEAARKYYGEFAHTNFIEV